MKRHLLVVMVIVFTVALIGCGDGDGRGDARGDSRGGGVGGGIASAAPTRITVSSNPSPKHGFYTIGGLLAAGPNGVEVNVYSDDAYSVSNGIATLIASGRADNVVIRVMTQTGRNSSDCLLFLDSGVVSFRTYDSYEAPNADIVPLSTGGPGTGTEKTADLEKIDKAVFSKTLLAGPTYQPGNRLKIGVWNIVGGNSKTKLVPLISSYQG